MMAGQVENAGSLDISAPRVRRSQLMSSVRHAIDVLRCISMANAPIGVNEISRRVGLHKSSVSRLVATLEKDRLVQRDPGTERIALGIGLVTLAAPLLAGLEIRDVARPLLDRLARESGETVSYSMWDGSEAVSVEQSLGASAVRTYAVPGKRNPGHATAAGKMLLALEPRGEIERYLAQPLERFTVHTITGRDSLDKELRLTRTRGYAVNVGELEIDVGAVSAAILDRNGRVVGVITATVPMYRFGKERRPGLIERVVATAAEISSRLGHARPAT